MSGKQNITCLKQFVLFSTSKQSLSKGLLGYWKGMCKWCLASLHDQAFIFLWKPEGEWHTEVYVNVNASDPELKDTEVVDLLTTMEADLLTQLKTQISIWLKMKIVAMILKLK